MSKQKCGNISAQSPGMREKMRRVLMIFVLLTSGINHVMAEKNMTSDLICPCECAMVISTCDCTTAIQVKKEISQMKGLGFSEAQVFSALQAEYGKEIMARPQKTNSMGLWLGGATLSILFVFLGYIYIRKPKKVIVPDSKKYEQRFEDEYRQFLSEVEPDNIELLKDPTNMEEK